MNNALGRVPPQYAVPHEICKDASQADSLHTLTPAPIPRAVAWGASAPPWVRPPAQLCCPVVAPELGPLSAPIPGWLQDNAEAVSYLITTGNCTPLQGVCPVSGIPAASQFNPFLQLSLLALRARSFLGHKLPQLSSYN